MSGGGQPTKPGAKPENRATAWAGCGFVAGAVASGLGILLFSGLAGLPARNQLIDQWRQIRPEMTTDEVVRLLGEPDNLFEPGTGFPDWARQSVPDNYQGKHGLMVFTVKRVGPQLLLVYFDRDRRVIFVSSTST